MINKLSILIPAYNEEATIELILEKVKNVELINGIQKEIIIVNDCSTDNTVAKIEAYKATNPALDIQLFFSGKKIGGKGQQLIVLFKSVQEITSLFRMPTWSMTPKNITLCLNRFLKTMPMLYMDLAL